MFMIIMTMMIVMIIVIMMTTFINMITMIMMTKMIIITTMIIMTLIIITVIAVSAAINKKEEVCKSLVFRSTRQETAIKYELIISKTSLCVSALYQTYRSRYVSLCN
jgi:hypothetical protein